LIRNGGDSSFGPPSGIPLLAQSASEKQKIRIKNNFIFFIVIC